MHWEPCEVCKESIIIFDLKRTSTGFRCEPPCIPKVDIPFTVTPIGLHADKHPLQLEFGFDKPEDGSERRFVFSKAKQGIKPPWMKQNWTPWARHRFWWWVHNAVAHSLIAFIPIRVFFRFHDYTSRRMHGK